MIQWKTLEKTSAAQKRKRARNQPVPDVNDFVQSRFLRSDELSGEMRAQTRLGGRRPRIESMAYSEQFDVLVVGAGHAGCEAAALRRAWGCARRCLR